MVTAQPPLPAHVKKFPLPPSKQLTPNSINTTVISVVPTWEQPLKIEAPLISTPQQQLVLVKKVIPKYPIKLLLAKQEANIRLSFTLNDQGGVENIKLISPTTESDFTRAAKKALKQWRYKLPSTEKSKPLLTKQIIIEFNFNLPTEHP
jgi:TonB family protein